MVKPSICVFTSIEGHRSIADSIVQALEKKYTVHLYVERDQLFNLYLPIYQLFPGAFKFPFRFAQKKRIVQMLHSYFKEKYFDKVSAFCEQHQPVACISTYFMYNSSLGEVCQKRHIPFFNVLTDPRTVHPVVIAEHAIKNFAFDEAEITYCQKFVPSAKYESTGWFLREQFQQEFDQQKIRRQLGLEENIPTWLITSGSEGTTIVSKIFPSLLSSSQPLQIIVGCGRNKTLLKSVKTLANVMKKSHSKVSILPIGFTTTMELYMQAADLVVGKAGPNMLFESVATHTPFFVITHIAGQEDGNLQLVREYGLGYVEENVFKAGKLLRRILDNPDELQSFIPNLKKLARYNAQAKEKLLKIVAEAIEQK